MSRKGTLHQTFDLCLPCIASFTRSMQRSSSRSVVDTTTQKYETRSNNVKCLMRVTQDRVHMLLPHTCVVRHRCSCSGTPQGYQYMISQLVPEGCIRCSCSGTPQRHQHAEDHDAGGGAGAGGRIGGRGTLVLHEHVSRQPSGVFVSKGWPLHDKGAQNHTLYRLLMNRLWSVFLRDLVYSMSASWTRARGRCSRPLPQASLRRCGRYAVRACLLDAVVFSSLCRLS